MRRLVYLLYGSQPGYRQEAKYSILSVLRRTPRQDWPEILIYTDQPNAFAGWPVTLVPLDAERLSAWSGHQGYLHRCKASAMRDMFERPGASIFVDTDTFFVDSSRKLFNRLEAANWLVDEVEGTWGEWQGEVLHNATAQRLCKERGIGQDMLLINSGVLGINKDALACMERAIELIDEIYPLAPEVHVIEQFAVGCAAYQFELGTPAQARGVVKHYYGDKLFWRLMLCEFFVRHGEAYDESLVRAVDEMPRKCPKPSWWWRLYFRGVSVGMRKADRKAARAAFFATHLPGDVYSQCCAIAYALDCLRAQCGEQEKEGRAPAWLKRFTARQIRRLDELLEQARKLI